MYIGNDLYPWWESLSTNQFNTLAGFPQAPVLLAEGAQVCAVAAPWRKWRGFGPAKRSNTWKYYMKKLNTENKIWIEMWQPLGLKVSLMFDQHSWILTLQDLSHKNAVPWLECLHSLARGCLPKATSKTQAVFTRNVLYVWHECSQCSPFPSCPTPFQLRHTTSDIQNYPCISILKQQTWLEHSKLRTLETL